ncbi:hypothetical protein NPIL_603431, partial [Nephila pilipes]
GNTCSHGYTQADRVKGNQLSISKKTWEEVMPNM